MAQFAPLAPSPMPPRARPVQVPHSKPTKATGAPPTGGNGPATKTTSSKNPFKGVIMSPKQMVSQASKQIAGIYNPVLADITSQQTAANGLAAKRGADAAAFQQWITQQSGALQAAAGARTDSLNSLLGTISTNAAAPQPANAGLTSTVSNMANSNVVGTNPSAGGQSTLGANQQATNTSAQGAVESAGLAGASNAAQFNAQPSISAAAVGNYLGQINAALTTTTQQLDTERATALGQRASDKQKLLSGLQSENATNLQTASNYNLKTNEDRTAANEFAATQGLKRSEDRTAVKEFNVGQANTIAGQRETFRHDNQTVNLARAQMRQSGAEFLSTQNTKTIDELEAAAQQRGGYTPEMKQELNNLFGYNVFSNTTTGTPTVEGKTANSENAARTAATQQAAYRDVTSRITAITGRKKTANDLTLGLLKSQLDAAATNSKIKIGNAEIKHYAAESGQSYATAKADIIKALAYAKAQGASANNSNAQASGTGGYANRYSGSGGSTGTGNAVKPMTTDSLNTYNDGIATLVSDITSTMKNGLTQGTGSKATHTKPLNYQQMRQWIVNNYGQGDAKAWAAFDLATAGGLTGRTVQMMEADGVPLNQIKAKYKILNEPTLSQTSPTAGKTGSPGIPPNIAGG